MKTLKDKIKAICALAKSSEFVLYTKKGKKERIMATSEFALRHCSGRVGNAIKSLLWKRKN